MKTLTFHEPGAGIEYRYLYHLSRMSREELADLVRAYPEMRSTVQAFTGEPIENLFRPSEDEVDILGNPDA